MSDIVSSRRRSALFVTPVAMALAIGTAGCVPSTPGAGADAPDTQGAGSTADAGPTTMTIGTTAAVGNYNPLVSFSRTDRWVLNLMYPGLMTLTETGELGPAVATDWGYGEDGMSAWVEIRDDMEWTDGEALDAEDVAYTITAVANEQLGVLGGQLGSFVSAEAVSDTRVEFTLSRTDGAFLNAIGFWLYVVPEHIFGQHEVVAEFANDSDWVAAGPFVMTEAQGGQRFVLEAVDTYPLLPEGRAQIDRVVYSVYPDVNTEVLALRSGELDLIANALPPAISADLANDDEIDLYSVPSLGWAHMTYNMREAPLDQTEVRRALAHAVDYEAIRQVVLGGNAESMDSSPLSPALPQWREGLGLEEYAFDPGLSRELLEDAGYTDNDGDGVYDDLPTFELIYDQADPMISTWAPLVRDQSLEAGIQIELVGLERNTYLARAAERDFDIYAGVWGIMDDPQANFHPLFHTDGFVNYSGADDAEVNRLLEDAANQLTREEALEPVQEIARIVHDEVYTNPVYVEQFTFAVSSEWGGLEPRPSDIFSVVNPMSLAQATLKE